MHARGGLAPRIGSELLSEGRCDLERGCELFSPECNPQRRRFWSGRCQVPLVEPMTESVLKIVTTVSIVLPQSQDPSRGLAVTSRLQIRGGVHLSVSLCPISEV